MSLSPQDPHVCRMLSGRLWGCGEGMTWESEGGATCVGLSYLLSPAPSFRFVGGAEGRSCGGRGLCRVGEGQGLSTNPWAPWAPAPPLSTEGNEAETLRSAPACPAWAGPCRKALPSLPTFSPRHSSSVTCRDKATQGHPELPGHTGLSQGTSLHTPRWKVPEARSLSYSSQVF